MNKKPYDRKILCLATLQKERNTCPFCGNLFESENQWCRFDKGDKQRFASIQVLYCKKCDLHFATEGQITEIDRRAGKIGMGKVAAFPIANMSVAEVRQTMYGTPLDGQGKTSSPAGRESGHGERKTGPVPQGRHVPVSKYLYDPHEAERFAEYNVPASTQGVVSFTEKGRKEKEAFILVDDPSDQDPLHNVFWTERAISELIVDTLARHRRVVKYRDFCYFINWYTGQKMRERVIARHEGYRKLRRIEDNARELVDVQIYRDKRPCIDHPNATEILRVNVFGIRTPEAHPIYVYYCPVCDEYYVNYDEYTRFCRKYGIPPFRLYDNRNYFGIGEGYYDSLREQSQLNLYGYNVNESNGLTMAARQQLLADIVDADIMKQAQICSFIEGIMRLHRNSPNIFLAMKKWEQDLAFIQAYKQDTSRVVWGRFVPGRGKKLLPLSEE